MTELAERPLISVVVPVYNREPYLAEMIRSILNQTYTPLELIAVVDEGSSDRSAAIVREFAAADARLRPLFLPHCSQWRARNTGVAAAQGALIAHMDDDDVALPDRFAAQLEWMRRTGVDICGGNVKLFGAENSILWFPETHQAICHELLFRISLFLPTALLPVEIARAHPYDETLVYSDYAMLTQIAGHYRLGNIPQVVLKARCHSQQLHILQSDGFISDERHFRRPFFRALFPDVSEADGDVFIQMTEGKPLSSLADLRHAGAMLANLAQTEDRNLARRMAGRWRSICRTSAHLGWPVYRLYRQMIPQFAVSLPPHDRSLALICALRLKSGSRLTRLLKRAWQTVRR